MCQFENVSTDHRLPIFDRRFSIKRLNASTLQQFYLKMCQFENVSADHRPSIVEHRSTIQPFGRLRAGFSTIQRIREHQ